MKVFVTLLCVVGLCMAGSDGTWFPWVNLVGLALFGALTLKGGRNAKFYR